MERWPDFIPLIDVIDRYIAKADDDLEEQLTEEGYPAAETAVAAASALETAIAEALEENAVAFIESVGSVEEVTEYISNIWPAIQNAADLKDILYQIFREHFDEMLRSFTFEWIIAENPVLDDIPLDEIVTKPAEAFIRGWSAELARIMNLNTKDSMERILLKAQEEGWSIERLADEIADSGIRSPGYRSRRVALTEMLRIESYAQQEAMTQDPLAYKKRWKHVMSAHPRENHMAMDGQEVYKREPFTLTGRDGTVYKVMCPRDTSLPASETVNCHCIMEAVADDNAIGMSKDEMKSLRETYMAQVNAEYDAWEQKFLDDHGITNPRDDPSVTWEIYNSYYEAYKRGEIANA